MTSTTPTPVRRHLTAKNTDVRRSHARVVEAFDPTLGWHTVDMPVNVGTAMTLCRRGQTHLAIRYNRTHGQGQAVADFTVAECLS